MQKPKTNQTNNAEWQNTAARRAKMMQQQQQQQQQQNIVACCLCGTLIQSNAVNMCSVCLSTRHDVCAPIEKNVVILQCKRCRRYQKEDGSWCHATDESKELLSYCLKKVSGLKQVRLVDASFVWTEPHSRRVKIKIKVQDEVEKGIILQQACQIEFIVRPMMCEDCHRDEASLSWRAVVQVRQKVNHKRTFLFLEQLILKHNAQEKALRVDPQPEGVDFYFATKTDASRFTNFLDSTVPVKIDMSEKLISADLKSNDALYNFSFSVEMAPICKDDLVVLPKDVAHKLGNISQLVLCQHVASSLRFIDFQTTQFCEVSKTLYFQNPFLSVLDSSRLIEFIVLDVTFEEGSDARSVGRKKYSGQIHEAEEEEEEEKPGKKRRRVAPSSSNKSSKHLHCIVECAREKDFGVNDEKFIVSSHLGYLLKSGDSVLGYDLSVANPNNLLYDALVDSKKKADLPTIVLVKKHYPKYRKKNRDRKWTLKSIANNENAGFGMGVRDENDRDMELFLRDLEEDEEMRGMVNLYKKKEQRRQPNDDNLMMDEGEDEIEQDIPTIPLDELLDNLRLDGDEQVEEEEEEEEEDDDDDL